MAKSGGRKRANERIERRDRVVADRAMRVPEDDAGDPGFESPAEATARLSFRLDPELKALIERAAAYTGQTVSSFAVSTLVSHARQVVRDHHVTVLSQREWEAFLHLLDNPSEPTEAALRAARRYRELVVEEDLDPGGGEPV